MFNKKISVNNKAVKILLSETQKNEVIAKLKAYRDEAATIKDVGSQRMFDLVSKIRIAEIDMANVILRDDSILNVSDLSFDIPTGKENNKEVAMI